MLRGAAPPLTLDDIAAIKQTSQGWGVIFKEVKTQSLVQEKNLGQVVRLSTGGGREFGHGDSLGSCHATRSSATARSRTFSD